MITAGKDAGQTGIISKVHRDAKRPGVTVKGMNLVILQALLQVQYMVTNHRLNNLTCSFAVQEAHQAHTG